MQAEFSGIRSRYYNEIMQEMPYCRLEERERVMKYLNPKTGEKILEIGAGTGFYSEYIAQRIFPGFLIATDPSSEQLMHISTEQQNIRIIATGGDTLPVGDDPLQLSSFDAVWAFGCFHHILDKTNTFKKIYDLLKPGGRLIISDVYAGSATAKYFDLHVAKYCITGHEVAFLSKEFADSLCYLAGFEKPFFYDVNLPLNFEKRKDIGVYSYKSQAMIESTPEECLKNITDLLDVEYRDGVYTLLWPHVVLCTRKPQ